MARLVNRGGHWYRMDIDWTGEYILSDADDAPRKERKAMKFRVRRTVEATYDCEVEAKDEAEAIEKAYRLGDEAWWLGEEHEVKREAEEVLGA